MKPIRICAIRILFLQKFAKIAVVSRPDSVPHTHAHSSARGSPFILGRNVSIFFEEKLFFFGRLQKFRSHIDQLATLVAH